MAHTVTHFRWKIERTAVILQTMRGPADVAGLVRELLIEEAQEVLLAVFLTTQMQVIGYTEVTRGTLDASLVHPREVFRGAIMMNAAGLIVAHNHPSGNSIPSSEDRVVTRQLKAAGDVIGIELFDSLIVGDTTFSFAEQGLL